MLALYIYDMQVKEKTLIENPIGQASQVKNKINFIVA